MNPLTAIIIDEDRRHTARLCGLLKAEDVDVVSSLAERPDVIFVALGGARFDDLSKAKVPIVLLAQAYEMDFLPFDRMEDAGVVRVLFKPVERTALMRALEEIPVEARTP